MDASFTADELRLLNNALNEVCNGIDIPDWEFATRLGASRAEANRLLRKINALLSQPPNSENQISD